MAPTIRPKRRVLAPPPPVSPPYPDTAKTSPSENTEFQAALGAAIDDAIQFVDTELSPDRALATDYYKGRPFGNEEEGRSKFVVPEVRNAIKGAIPDLSEVVFGPEYPVAFIPDRPEATEEAEIATEVAFTVFTEQNNGYLETLAVWKDAFLKKLGVYKFWRETSTETRKGSLSGVTEAQINALADEKGVTLGNLQVTGILPAMDGVSPPLMLYSVDFVRQTEKGKIKIRALPPEEFLYSRNARSLEDAIFVGHRRDMTVSELVALGYDREEVERHAGAVGTEDNAETLARQVGENLGVDPETGKANQKVPYVEAFFRYDLDNDGIAERRRVCAVGPGYHVLHNELADDLPFAIFCPDPEPHTITGDSLADSVMPFQRLKSSVVRSVLNSAAASIYTRVGVDQNKVSLEDAQNTEIGAIIRTDGPPGESLMNFGHTFMGAQIMPVLQFVDEEIERTTGQPKGVVTLDMDALQSTEKAAAAQAIRAGKSQAILYARIFCEGTLKPLFRGILKLLIQHADGAVPMRLRDRWVNVNPKAWDMDWDVSVKVALGSGATEQKIAVLKDLAAAQHDAITTGGPDNPITDVLRYRNTLAEITKLGGHPNVEAFWKTPQEVQQTMQAIQQQPPQPSPEMLIAQAELQKVQQQAQQAQMELAQKQRIAAQELEAKRERAATDIAIAREKSEGDLALEREKNQLELAKFQARLESEMQMKQATLDAELQIKRESLEAELRIKEAELALKEREGQMTRSHDRETALMTQPTAPDTTAVEKKIDTLSQAVAALAQAAKTMQAPPPITINTGDEARKKRVKGTMSNGKNVDLTIEET